MSAINQAESIRTTTGEVEGESFNPLTTGKLQGREVAAVQKQSSSSSTSQTFLLVATTVCALLSIIPPLRLGASLALRSVALLSVALAKEPKGAEGSTMKAAKIAAVALGLVGLAAALPLLLTISLAIDLGTQVVGLLRSIYEGDPIEALVHGFMLIIDTLALAGLIVGSWELMVASMSIAAFGMLLGMMSAFASIKPDDDKATVAKKILMGLFFFVLAGISVAGAVSTSRILGPAKEVTVKNPDPNGHLRLKAGDQISAPGEDLVIHHPNRNYNIVTQFGGDAPPINFCVETPLVTIHEPLSAIQFPTLPVGGPSLAAAEINTPSSAELLEAIDAQEAFYEAERKKQREAQGREKTPLKEEPKAQNNSLPSAPPLQGEE
ncbi:MAG: hypothetical protein KGJ02_03710 [Verrucomicrobiota bacterium]|nr:hypothetical protein [Verrucomicrobiota bacterium]